VGGSPNGAGGIGALNLSTAGKAEVGQRLRTWSGSTVDLTGGGVMTVGNVGAMVPAGGSALVGAGGVVSGTGLIKGTVNNHSGRVEPGLSAGTMNITGNYTQAATGSLQMELASATSFDKLLVIGNMTLGGTLEVVLLDGYVPSGGAEFDILDWTGTFGGSFSTLILPPLPSVLSWNTSQLYVSGKVSVSGTLAAADFQQDGDVDGGDLGQWQTNFGLTASAAHTQGDANGDADVDGGDFLVWQRQFGLPGAVPASASAPEPASAAMALAALGVLGGRMRRR
jgi:MYXO-CTERM domain-containing protein